MYRKVLYAYAMSKISVSVRLTPSATQILKELAQRLGISQAAVIELALRKFARENQEPNEKK
jgi:predicted transcriptional regulator